ncbi:hypothetical protein ACFU8W_42290, partial [Streptomyces sp. NPDC057565]|uniref:hypothetical protein n=1 Tax=Streptomyces sp. NPDC057565 TaxID=3346169 RepID=UPI00367ADDEB
AGATALRAVQRKRFASLSERIASQFVDGVSRLNSRASHGNWNYASLKFLTGGRVRFASTPWFRLRRNGWLLG